MISNPATFFVSGSEAESFEYGGGSTLYHFSPKDSGLSTVCDCNIIFFADSVDHAKEVLIAMFQFKIGAMIAYNDSQNEFDLRPDTTYQTVVYYLDNSDKWVITEAPTNQVYLVSWASNDTI